MDTLQALSVNLGGTDPDLLTKAGSLRRGVSALMRRLRALRADHGIRASKLSVLGHLARARRPLTASHLAALERLQPQSLTRSIAELDEAGLIRRCENEADRRQLLIELTQEGEDLLVEDARRQIEWLASQMSGRLTPAERDILVIAAGLMEKLLSAEPPT